MDDKHLTYVQARWRPNVYSRSGRTVSVAAVRRAGCLILVAAALVALPTVAARGAATCDHALVPYAGMAGASLTPVDHVTRDKPAISYTMWSGTVPGFDGMPFSVDVTVPCNTTGPTPTIVMAHGFSDDKTVWEETGKSDRVISEGRPEQNSRWNNIWFVTRGYVVVTYTARGWRDSCGPSTAGATALTPAPQCLPFEYWIHLNDKRWEVRDAQWLAGALVQSGMARADRLAITGGSYGGGPPLSGALLADRTMCGGAAVPASLGADPCAGKENGELVPWRTPDGTTPLTWAVSVPMYTYADLLGVLTPNGRGTDGSALAPPDGSHTDPFGVPIVGTIAGLYAAGSLNGFFSPPLLDPDADIFTNVARLEAGNPFPQEDPLVARGVRDQAFKSPITTVPQGRVPIFYVQGLTDPLFPATEALQIRDLVLRADPAYPIKVFLGDFGHDYTGQRQDEWDLAHEQMSELVDHYLRPDRTPDAPTFDVGSTVTRCLDHDAPMRFVQAPTWDALQADHITFTSNAGGTTLSLTPGPAGLASDPITTATLPLPGAYRGCRIMRPSQTDPTVVTYLFDVDEDLVLMGSPVIDLEVSSTAPDTQLHARLWDVAPDGSAQGLITRGTYRSLEPPGSGRHVRFQLTPQGYRFPAGHQLKVEVTANDFPYFQQSNIPAVVQVASMRITLPLHERPGTVVEAPPADLPTAVRPGPARLPATGGAANPLAWCAVAMAAVVGLKAARRATWRWDRSSPSR
jgi:predicted acyl esterase